MEGRIGFKGQCVERGHGQPTNVSCQHNGVRRPYVQCINAVCRVDQYIVRSRPHFPPSFHLSRSSSISHGLWTSLPDPAKQIESRERFVAELRRRYLDRMLVVDGGATL
ncbi:hypothetical protein J6590_015097 [Homalodisca vitripennis]|nr:hypothetical protein J6590_015097 [Homalodisca vitripennis]